MIRALNQVFDSRTRSRLRALLIFWGAIFLVAVLVSRVYEYRVSQQCPLPPKVAKVVKV